MELIQLVVLFLVIFDPPASFTFFLTASRGMTRYQRTRLAFLSVVVAAALSYTVLILGEKLLVIFSTTMAQFKVAGGIILCILGIKMVLGMSLVNAKKNDKGLAIASIIGTPLLTGPAAITAIIITSTEYGKVITGFAITIVLLLCMGIFSQADRLDRMLGKTFVTALTTFFGLITLAWGVGFIVEGIALL